MTLPRGLMVCLIVGLSFCLALEGQEAKKSRPLPKTFTNSIGMKFKMIEPGSFLMGAPKEEVGRINREYPHEVEITTAYYIGIHEVTQGQYQKVTGENLSFFSQRAGGDARVKGLNTKDFPVERVAWEDAILFCIKLTALETADQRVYDLPTEAEWEYACRAGKTTPYAFGLTLAPNQANFRPTAPEKKAPDKGNHPPLPLTPKALDRTDKVGAHLPNAWGIYDMHGNVAEWCKDWYDKDYYHSSPTQDPQGAGTGLDHVIRGGSWNDAAELCRSAYRSEGPTGGRNYVGFRVVMRVASGPTPMAQKANE